MTWRCKVQLHKMTTEKPKKKNLQRSRCSCASTLYIRFKCYIRGSYFSPSLKYKQITSGSDASRRPGSNRRNHIKSWHHCSSRCTDPSAEMSAYRVEPALHNRISACLLSNVIRMSQFNSIPKPLLVPEGQFEFCAAAHTFLHLIAHFSLSELLIYFSHIIHSDHQTNLNITTPHPPRLLLLNHK